MKKLILLALGMCAMSAYALQPHTVNVVDSTTTITNTTYYNTNYVNPDQNVNYYNEDVFKNAYFKVSWVNEELKPVDAGSILGVPAGTNVKCDWGVALDWGGMQNFTHRPIADMVNIGLDIHLALQYANYKDAANIGTQDKPVMENLNHASAGIGIGPAVAVAPFAKFDSNILQHLTAKAFYHFTPSYSALFYKDDEGDTAFKGGFCLYQSFGFEIAYRRLGVGIEHIKGSTKYSDLDVKGFLDGTSSNKEKSEKQKIESSAFRVFVSLKF